MFYSQVILARKGPLGKIWLAAHWDKKLTKQNIFSCDITESVDNILNPATPLALRVSGHLMLGVVRIYSRKVRYLIADCADAMWKIKLAFRPGNVDLPEAAATAAAGATDDPRFFGAVPLQDYDFPELAETAFAQNVLTQYDELRAARGRGGSAASFYAPTDGSGFLGETPGFGMDNVSLRGDESETASRVSDIEMMRREQRLSRSTLSGGRGGGALLGEEEEDLLMLGGPSASAASKAKAASLGAGKRRGGEELEDEIPAFEDQDLYVEGPEFEMDLGGAGGPEVPSPAGVRLSSVISPMRMSPLLEQREGEEEEEGMEMGAEAEAATAAAAARRRVKPRIETIAEEEAPAEAELPRRKRQKRPVPVIDTRLELSSKEIRQFLTDTGPTLRRAVVSPTGVGAGRGFALDCTEAAVGRGSLSVEERFAMPSIRGLCPELQSLFAMAMQVPKLGAAGLGKRGREAEEPEVMRGALDLSTSRLSAVVPRPSMLSEMEIENAGGAFDEMEYAPEFDMGGEKEIENFPTEYGAAGAEEAAEFPSLMEDVPIFEEGEEVAGAGEAAAASVVSSENWSTRTNDMLDILRKQFEKKESVTFQELCKGANRRTAAACFMEVLQLKTWGLVETAQTTPFGAISVAPTPKLVLVQT